MTTLLAPRAPRASLSAKFLGEEVLITSDFFFFRELDTSLRLIKFNIIKPLLYNKKILIFFEFVIKFYILNFI